MQLHSTLIFTNLQNKKLGASLKAVKTDEGWEYKPLPLYLQQIGVTHIITYPHKCEQNDIVESKCCHIVELGLTLMAEASTLLNY